MTDGMPGAIDVQYVVLRGNQETGPFEMERLRAGLQTGEFFEDDLVRRTDDRLWTSLSRLMLTDGGVVSGEEFDDATMASEPSGDVEPEEQADAEVEQQFAAEYAPVEPVTEPVPRTSSFLHLTFIEVPWRTWFARHPGTIALACAGLAIGAAFFVRWPLLVCLPWMLGGVAAGFSMILKGRPVTGVFACLLSLLAPLALLPAGTPAVKVEPTPEPLPALEVKRVPATVPATPVPAAAPVEAAKSGVPALGLPEPR